MKSPIRKSKPIFAIIALLAASVMIPSIQTYAAKGGGRTGGAGSRGAQSVRNATRNNARPQSDGEGPLANINENWYLEFTPGYISAGGSNLDSFFGASVAVGYKLSLEDRIQLEIGFYGSNNYSGAISYPRVSTDLDPVTAAETYTSVPLTGTRSVKATMVPVLFSYSYSIRLDSAERWEFRLTPAVGTLAMFDTWSINASDAAGTTNDHLSGSDSKYALALGGGFGLTWYFAERWYADIGYRYLWTAKVSNKHSAGNGGLVGGLPDGPAWNGVNAWNGLNAHFYTVALGWKF